VKTKPGRKIGKLVICLERKATRYQHASVEFELRLDSNGMFHAAHEGQWFQAESQVKLKEQLHQAIDKTIDVEWRRYLMIDYTADVWPVNGDSGRPSYDHSGHVRLDLDADRAELARDPRAKPHEARSDARVITGIGLHWTVVEFSSPYALPHDPKKHVRMQRGVNMQLADRDDDGRETYQECIGEPHENDDDRLPCGAVPWTAERETLLREILAALARLDARMVELLRGDPESLAARLDAATQQDPSRLLAAESR
jgi:hypothetical protein